MKLDRNIDGNEGCGKYALLKLRVLATFDDQSTFGGLPPDIENAIALLEHEGILDWGEAESESEFFVIRLKDRYARHALLAYSEAAATDDPEWADEVGHLAERAGMCSPYCKQPD